MAMLLIPVLFLLAIAVLIIIPVIAALIYNSSYNRYLNEHMADGTMPRKKITPLALGIIIFLIEIILMVGITVIGIVVFRANVGGNTEMHTDFSENFSTTYTQENVPDEYAVFNGAEVEGYDKLEYNSDDGDFHYFVYKRGDGVSDEKAAYVLCVEYKGKAAYNSAMSNIGFTDKDGGQSVGIVNEKSDRYYGVVDLGRVIYRKVINKDGKQMIEERTSPPENMDVQYEMLLFNDFGDGDIDAFDPDIMTGDMVSGELRINLTDLDF